MPTTDRIVASLDFLIKVIVFSIISAPVLVTAHEVSDASTAGAPTLPLPFETRVAENPAASSAVLDTNQQPASPAFSRSLPAPGSLATPEPVPENAISTETEPLHGVEDFGAEEFPFESGTSVPYDPPAFLPPAADNVDEEPLPYEVQRIGEQALDLNRYWIVSSRSSVQTIHKKSRGPWHLDIYRMQNGGQSQSAAAHSLLGDLIPGVPVCIVAHGSFVTWESNCQQACQAFRSIRRSTGNTPLQVIFFTWPSDGPYTMIPQLDVSVRGKQAEFNGFHLATLLSCIPEACPVTMIGHSHGCRVVLAASQLAAGGAIQEHRYTGSIGAARRMRVVLTAGAIDHHWLNPGQPYGLALNRLECLLNLRNQNDLPLALYPLHRPFARRAVARSGFTERDRQALGWNSAKIREVDVTNAVGRSHFWPDYYGDANVMAALVPYLISF